MIDTAKTVAGEGAAGVVVRLDWLIGLAQTASGRRITYAEVADAVGVNRSSIARLITGPRPNVDLLCRLIDWFEGVAGYRVTIDDLLAGE